VVVCTYNRAHLVPDALQSLLKLDVPDDWQWDILVVDNRSSDTTAQIVAELMRANDDRIHYVFEPEPGVAAARNCGIARSSGDWIAFFDDDQIADPAWLRELLELATSENVRVVGGAVHLLLPAGATDLPREAHSLFGTLFDQPDPGRAFHVGGGNVLFHRSVFEEIGVYDPSLREGGEDTDLARRLRKAGIAMERQPRAVVHHRIAPSRLETPALLAAARRVGWGFGRRDYRAYGAIGLLALCCARILMFAFKGSFRYVRAWLAGDRRALLGVRVDTARTRAYCVATVAFLLPESLRTRLKIGEPSFRDELGRTASQANTGQP
jgi:glycosyltransferase involved in cell wall biosynthesis